MELFSALDNALSQKAQDTLTEFAAVKKADVQLQTPLGNRKAQIGINIMGAFTESQNSAFGWQVRAMALAAVAFWLPDVSRAAQKIRHRRGIADCRLPIADCRLPIADCRLPIADCRFYGNGVCGQVILVSLCHVFSFVLCQWLLPPTKAIIHKKPPFPSFPQKRE